MTECQIVDGDGIVHCTCSIDDVLLLLADARRRQLVAVLERCEDDWIRLETLIGRLSSTIETVDVDDLARELHHVHLPMLDDRGLVEFDAREETIRYYNCDLVGTLLAAIEGH